MLISSAAASFLSFFSLLHLLLYYVFPFYPQRRGGRKSQKAQMPIPKPPQPHEFVCNSKTIVKVNTISAPEIPHPKRRFQGRPSHIAPDLAYY